MNAEFDSNVLVYAHDPTTPAKHDCARSLVERLWLEKTGRLSTQVMQEFFWIVTRKIPSPLPRETALAVLFDLSLWPVYSPVAADLLSAGRLAGEVKISFWTPCSWSPPRLPMPSGSGPRTWPTARSWEEVQIFNPFLES